MRFISFSGTMALIWMMVLVTAKMGHSLLVNELEKNDLRPCVCKSCSEINVDVECFSNKFSSREIQAILNRTDPSGDLFELHLRFSSPTINIPANLLNGRRFNRIFIHCSNSSHATQLKIDPNAFRTSSFRTDTFRIFNCDLSHQTDFSFLTDFDKLTSLSIQSSYNVESFSKLPYLPELRLLTIFNSTGLEKMETFPENGLIAGLKELDLALNLLTDETLASILRSIASSPSAKTIEILRLSGNRLAHIPDNKILSSLTSLNQFFLDGNSVTVISKQSLDFSSRMPNLTVLNLMDMTLSHIEANAFKHVNAKVHLDVNNLTLFEPSVYKQMLERSYQTGTGGLTFTSNLVECDCGLAWLIRDNRHLLTSVEGTCLNTSISTNFKDIDVNNYTNCTDVSYNSDNENRSWLYFLLLKLVGVGI